MSYTCNEPGQCRRQYLTLDFGLNRGRYELRGGTLKIVLATAADKPRPAGFEAEKDEGVFK